MFIGGKMLDLIILGSGPAGLVAGLYAGRYNLKTAIIGDILGGAMNEAWKIENYPGFLEVSGSELAQRIKNQVENVGVKIYQEEVTKIEVKRNTGSGTSNFQVFSRSGREYESQALILAMGVRRRRLNVPGEEKFHGRGVSYCATCDGPLFKDKYIGIVGGGDSAIKTALLMVQYAKKIYMLVRGSSLTGEPKNVETIKNLKFPIEIIYNVEVLEIKGKEKLESLQLSNGREVKLDGLFVEIGGVPASLLFKNINVELDEKGYVKVDDTQRTNIKFVYAAGDICTGMGGFKQILTAAAQGAVAATSAYKDLKR